MNKDTADEHSSLDQYLYSIGNRIEIAKLLNAQGKTKLLETCLEDIFYSVQCMAEAYCVVK